MSQRIVKWQIWNNWKVSYALRSPPQPRNGEGGWLALVLHFRIAQDWKDWRLSVCPLSMNSQNFIKLGKKAKVLFGTNHYDNDSKDGDVPTSGRCNAAVTQCRILKICIFVGFLCSWNYCDMAKCFVLMTIFNFRTGMYNFPECGSRWTTRNSLWVNSDSWYTVV